MEKSESLVLFQESDPTKSHMDLSLCGWYIDIRSINYNISHQFLTYPNLV